MHHHTTPAADDELPFNPANRAIDAAELDQLLADHGLPRGTVRNPNLYRCAFVHSSYVLRKNQAFDAGNERRPPGCLPLQEMAYERLEFLGDAVLGCACGEYLYKRFPSEDEGFLTRMRTGIVNGASLADIAAQMDLGRFAIVSRQIEEAGGRENPRILEDIFEALVGAILVDSGGDYGAARAFLVAVFETYVDWSDLLTQKPHVKERLAKRAGAVRSLEVEVATRGGRRVFTVAAKTPDGRLLGTGRGASRRLAERAAANDALRSG